MTLWSRFQSQVKFPIVRIDDRLIHGQVILGWAEPFKVRPLILIHNELAQDNDLKDAIANTVPSYYDFSILTIDSAIPFLKNQPSNHRTMIVMESPSMALALWERGVALSSIHIGGLHCKGDRIELLPYIYMTTEEKKQITHMVNSGVEVVCQDLPCTAPIPWKKLQEKLSIK
jgi:mannose/fructose/N-acetylgalactosamine-specific phosphotransferase system component IIB